MIYSSGYTKEDNLQTLLQTRVFGRTAYKFNEIDSTNRFAKKIALQGAEEGTLVYAEKQSQGYGRRKRHWHSPSEKGLWFSIILKPHLEIGSLSLLTQLGVTSTAIAIEQVIETKLQVKWPNDLLLNHKKVAGILVEAALSGNKTLHAVLGIGININQEEAEFSPEIRSQATSLRSAGYKHIDRNALLAQILLQLEKDYFKSLKQDFSFVLSRWITRSSILGKDIRIKVNGSILNGRVKGFHGNGELVLVLPHGGEERITDGTILEVNNDPGY